MTSKPQILVVDDEKGVVKSIERALHKEYNVSVAYSGVQGLKIARRIPPSLIILDIMMPGLDGYDMCRELRKDPLLSLTPILFLSALSTVESKIKGFESGADDYLVKPFDLRELHLRIKAILRRSVPQQDVNPARIIDHGDLALDCQSFELNTPDGTVQLTPIEFDLLYYLITHSGEAFTSPRLLQEVWDYPSDTGSPDLVRMHIRNIRKKIEPNPRKPIYLRTIPRHGYMIS